MLLTVLSRREHVIPSWATERTAGRERGRETSGKPLLGGLREEMSETG